MKIDEQYFRALLAQAIDQNILCCRAVFSLCRVEFTSAVPTLAVTLGARSVLLVNLDFIREHCETEEHVHAVLLHEFLHILLGHTVRFPRMTDALNIALDAVINAIIHRTCGVSHSSMMFRYYGNAKGPLRLLRPMTYQEINIKYRNSPIRSIPQEEIDFQRFHYHIQQGEVVSSDILDFVHHFASEQLKGVLRNGPLLLGGHDDWGDPLSSLPPELRDRVRQSFATIRGSEIWRGGNPLAREFSPQPVRSNIPPASWGAHTRQILRRLLVPDPQSRVRHPKPIQTRLPVLNSHDRRGALRTLWNPLIPEMEWSSTHPRTDGTVQVYFDVSGSIYHYLSPLIALLSEYSGWIRHPLWAFSTEVAPATIREGRLETKSTGGTSFGCVIEHARQSGARKALVVTDGLIEGPPEKLTLPCPIEALIPYDCPSQVLADYGITVTNLPPLNA